MPKNPVLNQSQAWKLVLNQSQAWKSEILSNRIFKIGPLYYYFTHKNLENCTRKNLEIALTKLGQLQPQKCGQLHKQKIEEYSHEIKKSISLGYIFNSEHCFDTLVLFICGL